MGNAHHLLFATALFVSLFSGCAANPERGPKWSIHDCADPAIVFLCETRRKAWGSL